MKLSGSLIVPPRPIWDPATGRHLHTLDSDTGELRSVAFGVVDGRTVLATGWCFRSVGEQSVRVWDAATGRHLQTLDGHIRSEDSWAFGVLAGRTVLATGGRDESVRVWDPVTGQHLAALTDFDDEVSGLAFGVIDGQTLLAASSGNHIQVFQVSGAPATGSSDS